jgi:hypothetical protein
MGSASRSAMSNTTAASKSSFGSGFSCRPMAGRLRATGATTRDPLAVHCHRSRWGRVLKVSGPAAALMMRSTGQECRYCVIDSLGETKERRTTARSVTSSRPTPSSMTGPKPPLVWQRWRTGRSRRGHVSVVGPVAHYGAAFSMCGEYQGIGLADMAIGRSSCGSKQFLKRCLHALGVGGGVRQRVAVGGRADRERSVVARHDVEEVQAADQRP